MTARDSKLDLLSLPQWRFTIRLTAAGYRVVDQVTHTYVTAPMSRADADRIAAEMERAK